MVSVGRRAIAIGIPRNDVLPIKPANCNEKLGNIFFKDVAELIINIKKEIVINAISAEWIKSILIPALRSKPITLMGIPNLIKPFDIFSEAEGLIWPIK